MRSIPAPATVLFEPGFRFDGYELLVKIGQGGMASVWLARTKNANDDEVLVAVKTVLPELVAASDLGTMLLDEARIAMAIESPYVARVVAVGEVWEIPYLVLEYVAGESVDKLCEAAAERAQPIPPSIVARIVASTARGLHAAHELRGASGEELAIVHRDLSPQNVLLDESGRVKLIDFGVATVRERTTPDTAEGVMKGKVPFMAPEHAMGGDVDRRSDLWSLGAVAYVMLTGKEPHEASNDAARLIKKLSRDPIPALPAAVPPPLADAVTSLLAHSPDDRPATAAALADTLEATCALASEAEVAAFVRESLGETMRARQVLVERALAAATARARTREMLSNPAIAQPTGEGSLRPSRAPEGSPSPAGTVSLPPKAEAAQKPWMVYLSACAIALSIVLAYALGASTGRASATAPPPPIVVAAPSQPLAPVVVPGAAAVTPANTTTKDPPPPPPVPTASASATSVTTIATAPSTAAPSSPTSAPGPSAAAPSVRPLPIASAPSKLAPKPSASADPSAPAPEPPKGAPSAKPPTDETLF